MDAWGLTHELGDAFTCGDALSAGMTRGRLRTKRLEPVFHGVRMMRDDDVATDTDPRSVERHRVLRAVRGFVPLLGRDRFFAGRTAAVLFDAPIQHGDDITVGVRSPARAPRRRGVVGVKVSAHLVSVMEHSGLPVASPASSWAMLGSEMSVRELVLGDWFVRVPRTAHGAPAPELRQATPEQLRRVIAAGQRPGISRLRAAVELVRVGSASPLETEYRLDAAAEGLPEPELDVEIRDPQGRLIGITEVAYRDYRTLVEIEGDHHRTDRRQWIRDIEKYNAYAALGWDVVRLTSPHIRASRRGVAMVRDALVRHGWRPGR
ncbi:hypothetical protein [Microbacterium invictum]|uniref:DUF559 domain-containing protein n=1 Tax=Microbacterium invictum TaxID=515415 RepID=A0ABZ0VHZ3_9MICO|nr:hypothetical protein [Microbacterium invictum]WQB71422.1 hypothetical protein T9R20_05520 [Microbacterium invictum]